MSNSCLSYPATTAKAEVPADTGQAKTENFVVPGIVPFQKVTQGDGSIQYKVFGVDITLKQFANAMKILEETGEKAGAACLNCGAIPQKVLQPVKRLEDPTAEFCGKPASR
ncbi:MAG: hypothetical protein FWF01_00360 [Alphaproteobacteria bacterium]|nr:hypothetical protein [Alphaproteobacteria bacterium]